MVWAMPETALGFFPGACDVRPVGQSVKQKIYKPVKETHNTSKRDLQHQEKRPTTPVK